MQKLTYIILVSALVCNTAYAKSVSSQPSEGQIKKEFFEDCLASSNDKYELYAKCIGKFTGACTANPETYEHVMEDISVGPPARNCTERESIWWQELFQKNVKELDKNVHLYLKDKRILLALEKNFIALKKRSFQECHYETVRWGFRDGGDLVNIAGLDFGFRCNRNVNAENAVTVYLWNKHLKRMVNIND